MASLTFISGLLLGLVVTAAGAEDEPCSFPEYLQNKPAGQYWRSAWGTDGGYVEWRFNDTNLQTATYNSTFYANQTWECTSMENEHYVTRLTGKNKTMSLWFQSLTDNVVRTTCASTDAMCGETSTLLIANEPRSDYTLGTCNIPKGSSSFLPKVFNNSSYMQLCDAQPSILTSECMPGEGMRLEFASLTCLPSGFGLPTDVTLYCLESWVYGEFNVSLLGTTFYDPTHCMVFNSSDPNSVRIIPGWSCPTRDEEGMLKLESTPLSLEDRTDAYCDVKLCHRITNYNRICPKTCNLNAGSDTDATFVDVNGTWWDGETGGIIVEITDGSLKVDGFEFKAIEDVSYATNTYLISQTNLPSSCPPRVSCIQLETPSQSMLRYKISQSMAVTSSSADVCSENNFVNNDDPLGSKYRGRFMKNLVAIPDSPAVPCGYTGQFILHAEKCNGSLVADLSVFSVKLDCVFGKTTTNYSCLAGFPLKAFGSSLYRAVVTNSTDSRQCWIWTDDNGGSPRQVYQLSGIDCNQETVEGILSGKISERIKIRANVTTVGNTTTQPSTSEPTPSASSANDPTTQPSTSEPTPSASSANDTTTTRTGFDSTTIEEKETASGVSGGVVAGAVFGVLIGLVLLGVIGFYGYRYIAARRMPYRVL